MLRIRESFGAKLLAGLLSTVGLLLLVTFVVVRGETRSQEAALSRQTVASALAQFGAMEELRKEQADRLARPLVEGPRGIEAMTALIENDGVGDLHIGDIVYQIDLAGLLGVVMVTVTDADGTVLLTVRPDGSTTSDDLLRAGPVAEALVAGTDFEVAAYRSFDGHLYNMRVRVIETDAGRLLGTIAFALPEENDAIERVGNLFGVEVCYVIDRECLAGTVSARNTLAEVLVGLADEPDPVTIEAADLDWQVTSVGIEPGRPEEGARVLAVPLDEIRLPFQRITRALLLGGSLALAISILMGLQLSRGLTRPVTELVVATGRVAQGDYDTEVSVTSADEIGRLATAFNDMTHGLLLKEQYRSVLNKVVSQDVATELMKGDVELGGENRLVTVLFGDIRGFSTITEGMEPQRVIGFLNECMERLSDAVEAEGGVVDKYVGDEIMAVFGAPVSQGDDALRAVRAAVRMREQIAALNQARQTRGEEPIGVGVGLSTGIAVAGNMGSTDRLNYTVLGDIVNLGARLCSAAAAGEILVTEATLAEAGDRVVAEPRGARPFKGFSQDIAVFDVVSVQGREVAR